jgi:hypothetical protein
VEELDRVEVGDGVSPSVMEADGLGDTVEVPEGTLDTDTEGVKVEVAEGVGVDVGVPVVEGVLVCEGVGVLDTLGGRVFEGVELGDTPGDKEIVELPVKVLVGVPEGVRDIVPLAVALGVDKGEGVGVGVEEEVPVPLPVTLLVPLGVSWALGVALSDAPNDTSAVGLADTVEVPEIVVLGVPVGVPVGVVVGVAVGVTVGVIVEESVPVAEGLGDTEGVAPSVSVVEGVMLALKLTVPLGVGVGVVVPDSVAVGVGVVEKEGEEVPVNDTVGVPEALAPADKLGVEDKDWLGVSEVL